MRCDCPDGIAGRYHGLYRDRENALLFGVCAGIAHYFDIRVFAVRVGVFISLLVFTLPTMLLYFAATLLLKERTLSRCECRREREFWRSGSRYGA